MSDRAMAIGRLAGGLLIAVVLARIALIVEDHWAPLGLFPLLCGALLGAGVAGLYRMLPTAKRYGPLVNAVVAGIVFVATQHGLAYLEYRQSYDINRRQPAMQLAEQLYPEVRPRTFAEFMSASAQKGRTIAKWQIQGWAVWLAWAIEASLVTAAAAAVAQGLTGQRRGVAQTE